MMLKEASICEVNSMDRLISEQAVIDKLTKLVNELEVIFSDIRERLVDDSVCGLCEYDCDHGIDGFANECPGFERDDCFKLSDKIRTEWIDIKAIPSAEPYKGMTNGEVIKKLFPNVDKYDNMLLKNHSENILFDNVWWNSPYSEGSDKE